jgi:hypothetical protein
MLFIDTSVIERIDVAKHQYSKTTPDKEIKISEGDYVITTMDGEKFAIDSVSVKVRDLSKIQKIFWQGQLIDKGFTYRASFEKEDKLILEVLCDTEKEKKFMPISILCKEDKNPELRETKLVSCILTAAIRQMVFSNLAKGRV